MKKLFMSSALALSFAVLGSLPASVSANPLMDNHMDGAKGLSLESYLDWEQANNGVISPDGSQIIYTRRRVNKMTDRWDSTLWIMNVDGSKKRQLAEGGNAVWSPDGARIAYTKGDDDGKAQLFVRWMDDEGMTSQITHDNLIPGSVSWSPDGKRLAFLASQELEPDWDIKMPAAPKGAKWTKHATVVDTLHYRQDRVGTLRYNHLYVVDAEGGVARKVTKGKFSMSGTPEWTPDGRSIVLSAGVDNNFDTVELTDLSVVNVASGEIKRLTDGTGNWHGGKISPDGKQIIFSGYTNAITAYDLQEIRLINLDGSDMKTIAADTAAGVSSLEWDERGRGAYFNLPKEGDVNVYYISASNGQMKEVTRGDHMFRMSSISKNGIGVGTYSAPNITTNVAKFDLKDGNLTQMTDVNSDILAGVELGKVEEFWYDSSEGAKIQGWTVYPPDFDASKKYPMVLYIHGGPHGMYGTNFNFMFQEYAAKGYVVVYTNPRGSIGYGHEFGNAIDNAYPGPRDFTDLMRGVDEVVKKGFIDENQLYSAGCSGGGVLTTWIVGHTDRFAAAAALCPVTNWISFAGQGDVVKWINERFHNPWWEDRQTWIDHSPVMYVNQVKTPTMLMTGVKDLRTPIEQAEEFYTALKMLNVPTVLVRMEDEYHGTTRRPSNMLRTQLYLQKWFSEHKKGQ